MDYFSALHAISFYPVSSSAHSSSLNSGTSKCSENNIKLQNLFNVNISKIAEEKQDFGCSIEPLQEKEIGRWSLLGSRQQAQLKHEFKSNLRETLQDLSPMEILRILANFAAGGLITGGNPNYALDGVETAVNFSVWRWFFRALTAEFDCSGCQEAIIISHIQSSIEKFYSYSIALNKIVKNSADPAHIYSAALELSNRIKTMKVGESELLIGGWINIGGGGGHAQIYEIEKRAPRIYDFFVYTSTGFELAETFIAGSKLRIKPLIRYAEIPESVLLFDEGSKSSPAFIQSLIEIQVIGLKDTTITVGVADVINILDYLEAYRVSVSLADVGALTGQRGGTCEPSVTKVWIRRHAHCAEFYKQIMFHLTFKLLITAYSLLEKTLVDPGETGQIARRLLVQISHKLLRQAVKLRQKDLIGPELLLQAYSTGKDAIIKIASIDLSLQHQSTKIFVASCWQGGIVSQQQRDQRRKYSAEIAVLARNSAAKKTIFADLSININSDQPAISLIQALSWTIERCKEFRLKRCQHLPIGDLCLLMQVHHLIDQIPLPKARGPNPFWDSFSFQELRKAQMKLFELAEIYSHSKFIDDLLTRRYATVLSLQVLIHFLAVKIDALHISRSRDVCHHFFGNYKVPIYLDLLACDEMQFFDRAEFLRIKSACNYLNVHNSIAQKEMLFANEDSAEVNKWELRAKIQIGSQKECLTNGEFWFHLLQADLSFKNSVEELANTKYPDFTDKVIDDAFTTMQREHAKWQQQMELWKEAKAIYAKKNEAYQVWIQSDKKGDPVDWPGNKPQPPYQPIAPIRMVNLPISTKMLLLLEGISDADRAKLLEKHGYEYIDNFRKMNYMAHVWLYSNESDFEMLRYGSRWNDYGYEGQLSGISLPKKPNSKILESVAVRQQKLSKLHRAFLASPLTSRNAKMWQRESAEGSVLSNSLKNSLLYRLLRPLSQWKIAPEQLIYEIQKEWTELKNSSLQALFLRLFFRSPVTEDGELELGVGELILRNSAILDSASEFINRGLSEILRSEKPMAIAYFFFEMSFCLSKFLADGNAEVKNVERFNQLPQIKRYLSEKNGLSRSDESDLYFYQLLFYSIKKPLESQELAEAFACWIFLQRYPTENFRPKYLEKCAIAFIMRLTSYVAQEAHSKQFCRQLGSYIANRLKLKHYKVQNPHQWSVDAALGMPYLSDGSNQISLLEGKVYVRQGEIKGIASDFPWQNQAWFKRLFKAKESFHYEALGSSCIGFKSPDKGTFRIIQDTKKNLCYVLQHKIEAFNEWFQYEPLHEHIQCKKFPFPLAYDHAYWVPTSKKTRLKGVLTDLKTLQIQFAVMLDGKIIELLQPISQKNLNDPSWRGCTLDFLENESHFEGIKRFELTKYIVVYRHEQSLVKLAFPRYCSVDGNSLAFVFEENQLRWSENREYILPKQMRSGLLGTLKNYLFLESSKDNNLAMLLVPMQKIVGSDTPAQHGNLHIEDEKPKLPPAETECKDTQRYIALEYKLQSHQIEAKTIEARCLLAYIYLSQKQYERACRLLKGIKALEVISPIGMYLLRQIQKLPLGEDHPDGKMVQLHALRLHYKETMKGALELQTNYFREDRELFIRHFEGFSSVLQNANQVSASCLFDIEEEKELLHLLQGTKFSIDYCSNLDDPLNERLRYLQTGKPRQAISSLGAHRKDPAVQLLSKECEWCNPVIPIFPNRNDFPYQSATERIKAGCKHLNSYQEALKRHNMALAKEIRWFSEGLSQFDPEVAYAYPCIYPEEHFEFSRNGRLFLEVYYSAKEGPSSRQRELEYRLTLWRKKLFSNDITYPHLDCMLMILQNSEKFPPLISASCSDEDKYNFLLEVSRIYNKSNKSLNASEVLQLPKDKHLPEQKTNYPVVVESGYRPLKKPISSIAPEKIPLKILFPIQEKRWKQLQRWRLLLKKDNGKPLTSKEDFAFNINGLLNHSEQIYRSSLERDLTILSCDYILGKKQNKQSKSKTLSVQSSQELQAEVQKKLEKITAKRVKLEQKLLVTVNQRPLLEMAYIGSKAGLLINFQHCIDCLMSGDQRSYLAKNKDLSQGQIDQVVALTLEVLSLKSFEAQLKRVMTVTKKISSTVKSSTKKIKYDFLCHKLDSELSAKYHFEGEFSDDDRVIFDVFAGQTGLIPYKKQVALIKKMASPDPKDPSHYREIVSQLIMGGGKTSVIAVHLLLLLAKREGRVAVFIVPSAQFASVKANLFETLKALGVELLALNLVREQFTTYKLKEAYQLLLQAKNQQQPLILTASTLQGMELEFLCEMLKLKKLMQQRDALSEKIKGYELSSNGHLTERLNGILHKRSHSSQTSNDLDRLMGLNSKRTVINLEIINLSEKCKILEKILSLCEGHMDGLIDEVDIILDHLHELNYVDGEKASVDPVRNRLLLTIYQTLISEKLVVKTLPGKPTINTLVRLRSNEQSSLATTLYLQHIAPVIALQVAQTFSSIAEFLPKSFREGAMVRFVTGQIPAALSPYVQAVCGKELTAETSAQEFPNYPYRELIENIDFLRYLNTLAASKNSKAKQAAELIALAKHFLIDLVPACLAKEGGRNYGPSPTVEGKIIPYHGVFTPATTEFGYHWEAVAYHYQWGVSFKPSEESILALADFWSQIADFYVQENGEKFSDTFEYRHFKEVFGVALDTIGEKGQLECAMETLFKNPEKCLEMQFDLAERFATYSKRRLTSNGLALIDLIASRMTMSGTPWNADGFDQRLASCIHMDVGTEGRILHRLAERASEDKILEVILSDSADLKGTEIIKNDVYKNSAIQNFLQQIYDQYQQQGSSFAKIRGIIEAGGLFKAFGSNEEIAKGWMEFIRQKQEDERLIDVKTVDPRIEAVLYFGQEAGQEHADTLYVWRKGARTAERIGGTTAEALKAKGLNPKKYVIYYDERHTTGTDLPQLIDAKNLLTFDNMLMRTLTQSIMRLRLFLANQDIDIVISQQTRKFLLNQGKTVQDLVLNAAKEQSIKKTQAMVRYFLQQIQHIFRRHAVRSVRSLLRDECMQSATYAERIEAAEKFFSTAMEENPMLMHAKLVEYTDTKQMLQVYLMQKLASFKEVFKDSFIIAAAEIDAARLSDWIAKSENLPDLWLDVKGDIGVELEVEQKVQTEMEAQAEVQIEQKIEQELEGYEKGSKGRILKEEAMCERQFDALLMAMKNPEVSKMVIQLQKQLRKYTYRFERKVMPIACCFSPAIYGTVAYFHTYETSNVLSIFHPGQRPPNQILAVRGESGQIYWLLLSEHEANDVAIHLQKRYEKEKNQLAVWLLQPNGSLLLPGTLPFPKENKAVHNLLVEINAFAGNIDYLNKSQNRRAVKAWLQSNAALKVHFLKLRTARNELQRLHLASSVVIAEVIEGEYKSEIVDRSYCRRMCAEKEKTKQQLKSSFVVSPESIIREKRALAGEWKREYLLGAEGVRKLTVRQSHLLTFVDPQYFKELTESWQIASLPLSGIKHLHSGQIPLLSLHQLKAISREDLSGNSAFSRQLLAGITSAQWELIHGNLIEMIPPSERHHLNSQQIAEIDKPELIAKLEEISRGKSSWVAPKMVGSIPNPQISCLQTQEQVASLDNARVSLLKTRQIALISLWQLPAIHKKKHIQACPLGLIEHLSDAQIKYIKAEQAAGLSNEQLKVVSKGKKWAEFQKYLSPNQLRKIDSHELLKLFPPELISEHLCKRQVVLLNEPTTIRLCPKSLVRKLSASQIKHIVRAQVPFLRSVEQIAALPPGLFKYLTSAADHEKGHINQISLIGRNQVAQLNKKQVGGLTGAQINEFGAAGYKSIEESHPLWEYITPEIMLVLNQLDCDKNEKSCPKHSLLAKFEKEKLSLGQEAHGPNCSNSSNSSLKIPAIELVHILALAILFTFSPWMQMQL